jgi:hypothetical protein
MDYRSEMAYESMPGLEHEHQHAHELRPFEDALAYLREYARERPEVAALTCFAIGFVLGWKLKPW